MGKSKKFPTSNKETLLNCNYFCMIAFKARSECPDVSPATIYISSVK